MGGAGRLTSTTALRRGQHSETQPHATHTIQPFEILKNGQPTGRWRLTITSSERAGEPRGDDSHDHGSSAEALCCPACQSFCLRAADMPNPEAPLRSINLSSVPVTVDTPDIQLTSVGVQLGSKINGGRMVDGEGAHIARLNAAPMLVDNIPGTQLIESPTPMNTVTIIIGDEAVELRECVEHYWKGVIRIAGKSFHVEAVEIAEGGEARGAVHEAVNPAWNNWLEGLENLCNGKLETVQIDGRECVLAITPSGA